MAPDPIVTFPLIVTVQSPEGLPAWILQPGVTLHGPHGETWPVRSVKQAKQITSYEQV